ncbi:MAG: LrgB family protein [Methylibium sp.]|uniref:LrgB family protein n=1 Tax=Methylibium sp. TaxID=2067992 RepID=UPI0018586BB9|nr:LrgB family protein [Methylibium sp.]MBA3597097.1 LrgB family protein [Methylibium sp.]
MSEARLTLPLGLTGALEPLSEVWVYLAATPLFGLTLTLGTYVIAEHVSARSGRHPLANPVLWSVLAIIAVLWATGTPYRRYFEGAQFVHFLLGTATVALAVPLARLWPELRQRAGTLLTALLLGASTSIVAALGLAWMLGASPVMMASLLPKSVTAPIAMGIAERIGGSATLAAVFTVTTGIVGALVVTPLLNAMGVRNWAARGFALGLAAHGIGTARAWSVHPRAGAYASLAMGLHGVLGAVLLPGLARWL